MAPEGTEVGLTKRIKKKKRVMGPEGTEVEITIKIANCLTVQTAPFQVFAAWIFFHL